METQNTQSGQQPLPSQDPNAFEKYKLKIETFKWFLGSVVLVLITTIIDWGFKDRSSGLLEVQAYDKYATELIILNNDPVKKRMLAQYFANVIPSEKLRDGWKNYFKEVDSELKELLKKDSLARIAIKNYASKDSLSLSPQQKESYTKAAKLVDYTEKLMKEPIRLPEEMNIPSVYFQVGRKEQSTLVLKLVPLISQLGYKVPPLEVISVASSFAQNEIRYFATADEAHAKKIQDVLLKQGIVCVLNYKADLQYKVATGLIEVWLK